MLYKLYFLALWLPQPTKKNIRNIWPSIHNKTSILASLYSLPFSLEFQFWYVEVRFLPVLHAVKKKRLKRKKIWKKHLTKVIRRHKVVEETAQNYLNMSHGSILLLLSSFSFGCAKLNTMQKWPRMIFRI